MIHKEKSITGPTPDELSATAKQNHAVKRIKPPLQPGPGKEYDAFGRLGIEGYIEGICSAVALAIDHWVKTASIVSVKLDGNVATVMPEGVEGPELKPFIMENAPQGSPMERKYSLAIANVLSHKWAGWQQGLTGMLAYPPFGPPSPNIPAPLITFSSAGESGLAPRVLNISMIKELGEPGEDPGSMKVLDLFDSINEAFYAHFQIFKTNTVVSGVICTPPTPPPRIGNAEEKGGPGDEPPDQEPVIGGIIPTSGNFL